jgi:nitrite reductase (NADH) small subunit
MAFQRAGSLAALPPGTMRPAKVGEVELALCNVKGKVHVTSGRCPHAGGPLGQGGLHGTTMVCPWHAWEFDCVTGEFDANPAIKLTIYNVKVEGDDIFVDVP